MKVVKHLTENTPPLNNSQISSSAYPVLTGMMEGALTRNASVQYTNDQNSDNLRSPSPQPNMSGVDASVTENRMPVRTAQTNEMASFESVRPEPGSDSKDPTPDQIKEQYHLKSHAQLRGGLQSPIFTEKHVYPGLGSTPVSMAELYSMMKFGHGNALRVCADLYGPMLEEMSMDAGCSIQEYPDKWSITTAGCVGTPGASSLLAQEVAKVHKIRYIPTQKTDTPAFNFSGLKGTDERMTYVNGKFYLTEEAKAAVTPHVIFLDDATASAAHLLCHAKLFEATDKAESFHSCVILDIRDRDHSVEEKLNTGVIKADPVRNIPKLLEESDYPMVVRMAKSMLKLSPAQFDTVFQKLSFERKIELIEAAYADSLHQKPAFKQNLATAAMMLEMELESDTEKYTTAQKEQWLSSACTTLRQNAMLSAALDRPYLPNDTSAKEAIAAILGSWTAQENSTFGIVSCNDNETLYRIAERCETEGLLDSPAGLLEDRGAQRQLESNLSALHDSAKMVHAQEMANAGGHGAVYRATIAVLDYDGTVTDQALTPMAPDVAQALTDWLASGRSITLVTNQPLTTRGISDYFIKSIEPSLKSYQLAYPTDPVHERILVAPGGGSELFRLSSGLTPIVETPIYAYVLGDDKEQRLVDLALSEFKEDLRKNEETGEPIYYPRGAYLSLHFPLGVDVSDRIQNFVNGLGGTLEVPYPMVAAPKNSKGKQVFHIKPAHMRKSIARDYLLEKMGAKRDSLLVAGDNMRRGGDDAAMFVCGGTNLLVGKGVRAEGLPVSNRLDNASALAQLLRRVAEKPLPE